MAKIEMFDPTTEAAVQAITYVSRPDSLTGRRVGLVENTKFNSDRLLLKIARILKEEYGAGEAVLWRKRSSSVPAHEEILQEARRAVDVVIAGIGD
jgi:hypothetical protein